jgi:hypothetical protein
VRTSFAFALALAAACSGTTGVRDHSEALAVATHCWGHACAATPEARNLGEGCYVVDDRLYQCSTDYLPAGQVSCFEIPRCVGACTVTVTGRNGRAISIARCSDRWRADREAHRPPPTCSPARLQVVDGPGAGTSSALPLPPALVIEVVRTGKSRVVYEAEACGTDDGVVVGEATRTTGFVELDRVLRGRLAELAVPPGACARVALIASRFECEVGQTLL